MSEPSLDVSRLKAVVFDLDGTLYRQGPLRRAMALRLLGAHVLRPGAGRRTMRTVSAYRKAQEELRGTPGDGDLAAAQLALAADRCGLSRDILAAHVDRWIEKAPLALLARFEQPGLRDLLASLRSQGIKLGVLSDYPPVPKLEALGILDFFDVVLCAQDSAIGVFKPDPRGLLVALQKLDVSGPEALYVGDRAEVDAVAASAAGVPCAIISESSAATDRDFVHISRFSELQRRLHRPEDQGRLSTR